MRGRMTWILGFVVGLALLGAMIMLRDGLRSDRDSTATSSGLPDEGGTRLTTIGGHNRTGAGAPVPKSIATRVSSSGRAPDGGASVRVPLVVSGAVHDAKGERVAEADVWLSVPASEESTSSEERTLAEIRTNERGSFTLECFEVPAQAVLNAGKSGYATAATLLQLGESQPSSSKGRRINANLVLIQAGDLRGRVVDGKGDPIPGASVIASHRAGKEKAPEGGVAVPSVQSWMVSTDAAGAFALQGLPMAEIELEASRDGFTPVKGVAAMAPMDNVVLTLTPAGAHVAGFVFPLGGGQGVSGATVRLSLPGAVRGSKGSWTVVTGSNGDFSFDGLPDGGFEVSVEKDRMKLCPLDAMRGNVLDVSSAKPVDDLQLRLYAGHTLRGKVTVEGTSYPLEGVTITALCEPPLSGKTGPDGTYRIEGLMPGSSGSLLAYRVDREGYAQKEGLGVRLAVPGLIRLDPEKTEIVQDIAMVRAITISGRVLTAAGVPVAKAKVRIGTDSEYCVETDVGGNYTLREENPIADMKHPGGGVKIPLVLAALVEGPPPAVGHLKREWDGKSMTGADIVISGLAGISGKVVDEQSRPVPDAHVKIDFPGLQIASQFTAANKDGEFGVMTLSGEDLVLRAFKPAPPNLDGPPTSVRVAVGERKTGVRVVLPKPKTLSGIVVDAAGSPIPMANILVTDGRGEIYLGTSCRDDGTFKIQLMADRVALEVSTKVHEKTVVKNVDMNRNDLRIVLNPGKPALVIGKVLDATTGEPLQDFSVTAHHTWVKVTKEGAGVFTAQGLVMGATSWFNASAPGYVSATGQPKYDKDSGTAEVTILLRPIPPPEPPKPTDKTAETTAPSR